MILVFRWLELAEETERAETETAETERVEEITTEVTEGAEHDMVPLTFAAPW
jgi:hypothetical protein